MLARLGIDPTEAFSLATTIENDKEIKTYKLSRFACLLVSMHADSKKEEVAKAKAALAALADQLIEEKNHEHDLGRIDTQEDLKLAEKVLSGTAQDAGLEKSHSVFKDAGFRGMYNFSLSDLMLKKGVNPKNVLYDFMELEELAGILFRVTQTSARIKSSGVQGLPALKYTANQVGKEVRKIMTKDGGMAPEQLPIAENISGVKSRMKSAARAMKKLDGKPLGGVKSR